MSASDDVLMSDDKAPTRLHEKTIDNLRTQRILLLDTALDDEIGSELCAQMVLLSVEDPVADIAL